MKNEQMMAEAPVRKLLLRMSLPMILVMIVNTLYNMADVFFIGRTGDALQVAALSLSSPVFSALSAFNTLIGFGGCTAVSMALGQGNRESTRKYTAFVTWGSLLVGFCLMALQFLFMPHLIPLLGANEETSEYVKDYLQILAIGTPVMILGGAMGNTIRADGESKNAVIATMVGTLLNILLDPLFISIFGWGCRGAAAATVIGNIFSCLMVLRFAAKKETFSVSLHDFTLAPAISLQVLKLGLPMAASTLLMSFSHTFANRLMVRYGNEAVAASSVSGKVSMLIPMIIMGICMGIQPALSYAYGAKNRARLKQLTLSTGLTAVLTGTAMAAICFLFRDTLIRAFIADDAVLELGRRMIIGGLLPLPLYGLYQISTTYLQAVGEVRSATLTSLLRQGIIYLPVLYLMEAFLGLTGLIYTSAVTDLLSTAVSMLLALRSWRKESSRRMNTLREQNGCKLRKQPEPATAELAKHGAVP